MRRLREEAAQLGIDLSDPQLRLFRRYYEELVRWRSRVNLTAVTDVEGVRSRHFRDSLSVALAFPGPVGEGARLLDVGSGAGFPGLPLKIAFPRLRTTLIEATAKKTAFLGHLVDALGLTGVEVLTGRAETLGREDGLREAFDLVAARAVAGLPALAELTLPFCRLGGLGRRAEGERRPGGGGPGRTRHRGHGRGAEGDRARPRLRPAGEEDAGGLGEGRSHSGALPPAARHPREAAALITIPESLP